MSRYEARAYVELADATIRRAWRYQSIWLALESGRVPAKLRREVLDFRFKPKRSQAIEVFDRWSNSPASDVPLILVGGMGRGKSLGAALWLLSVAERGESVAWLSAKELSRLPFDRDRKREADRDIVTIADEERRALKACATVFDDLGAGSLSATVMARINGLLLTREEQGLATAVLLNKDKDDPNWALKNIDSRLLDRMRTRRVKIIALGDGPSMRGASTIDEKVDDERGRGVAWFASAKLLRTVGVLDEFDNSAWLPEQGRAVLQPVFGHALQGHARRPDWPKALTSLCETAGISVADVRARAEQLQRDEDSMREQFEHADLDLGGELVVRGADGFLAKLVQDIEHDRGRHNGPQRAGDVLAGGRPPKPKPVGPEPKFADGERQRLAAMGYKVRHCDLTGEFQLRFVTNAAAAKLINVDGIDAAARKQRARMYKDQILGLYETEARAWDAARKLQAVVTDDGEDQGSWKTEKATA